MNSEVISARNELVLNVGEDERGFADVVGGSPVIHPTWRDDPMETGETLVT